MNPLDNFFIIGGIVLIIASIVGIYAFAGWLLSWSWNLLVPLFWAKAPHLTVWMGIAAIILLSAIGRLFGSKS